MPCFPSMIDTLGVRGTGGKRESGVREIEREGGRGECVCIYKGGVMQRGE